MEAVVEFSHVGMEFPGIKANDDVSLTINKGEIFALVGENGAGKSTLMNILFGMLTPTQGSVRIKGQEVKHFSPKNAISQGIGMVHQHFMLVPSFTVAQNIVLSREPKRFGVFYDRAAAEQTVEQLCQTYGLSVDPKAPVRQLGVGLQQRVEILKTLYRGADILILDEPTAVLTPQETEELFAVLRTVVREKAMTVILITHKLYEVMAISHRVGVMRQGRLVGVEETKNVNEQILASMMVGRDVPQSTPGQQTQPGQVRIQVRDLHVENDRGLPAVRGLDLQVRAGEILGIAAIEGNGQSELLEAITGLRPFTGEVQINGQSIRGLSPGKIRALGLAHIPEDRLSTGVSRQASISENLLVGKHGQFSKWGIHLNKKAVRQYAETLFQQFDIRAADMDVPVGSMSGGNMQKVVLAREFSAPAQVLVIAQPTRGVDIGAIAFIHSRILEKRDAGAAILLCSADLDEVMRLSDRIVTVYEGRITSEFTRGVSKAELGLAMAGGKERP